MLSYLKTHVCFTEFARKTITEWYYTKEQVLLVKMIVVFLNPIVAFFL